MNKYISFFFVGPLIYIIDIHICKNVEVIY